MDSSETTETVFLSVLEIGEIKVSASGMPAEDWLTDYSSSLCAYVVEGRELRSLQSCVKALIPPLHIFPAQPPGILQGDFNIQHFGRC